MLLREQVERLLSMHADSQTSYASHLEELRRGVNSNVTISGVVSTYYRDSRRLQLAKGLDKRAAI